VDLSDFSPPVLAHAVALAKWFGAEVTALHVFASYIPPASLTTYPGWMLEVPEARTAILKELEAVTAAFASKGIRVPMETAEGDPAAEIVQRAEALEVDLIVMGTHGRSGFDRFTLGSVTEKVLRKASCPVLTLPPSAPRKVDDVVYRRILCPIDFSPSSARALDFGLTVAAKAGAAVTVLHVVESWDPERELEGSSYIAELRRRQCETEQASLRQFTATRNVGARELEHLVVLGWPHREIVRLAAERAADLIVMGVRGRGPVDLTLFGSTTNQVVRRAACPVATIRTRE